VKSLFSTMQGGCTTMQDNLKMTAAEPFRAKASCRQRKGRARAQVFTPGQCKAASVERNAFLSRASSASTR
jgi:hypothetical protein